MDTVKPLLVFLPGWLGHPEDWRAVATHFPDCDTHLLPTPCLPERVPSHCHLVGYSMGGRVALRWAIHNPVASLTLVAAHPGLRTEAERRSRLEFEHCWKAHLQQRSLEEFLDLWYNQPLFSSLKLRPELLETILSRRRIVDIPTQLHLLEAESLAKQPSYWDLIPPNTLFLSGALDTSYQRIANELPPYIQRTTISRAGHALHLEAPEEVAQCLRHRLKIG